MPSRLPVITTEPTERSSSSESSSSSSSATISRFMKLCGGLSNADGQHATGRARSRMCGASGAPCLVASGVVERAERLGGRSAIRRWSATFRGDRPGPRSAPLSRGSVARAGRGRSIADVRRARGGRRPLAGSSPSGVPSSASNSSRSICSAWGRNSKIPPPPLLSTTMRTGALASRSAASPFMSWYRPRSPSHDPGRPPARGRGADPGRDQAVDPVRAPVAQEPDTGRARRRRTPPGRGSACSTPCRRASPSRTGAPSAAWTPGSVGSVELGELGVDRRRRPRRGVEPRLAPLGVVAAPEPRCDRPSAAGRGSARSTIAARRGWGSFQPYGGSTTTWRSSVERGEPLAQRLAGRHVAEADDQLGLEAVRPQRGRSSRRATRRARGRGCRAAAATSARRGSDSRCWPPATRSRPRARVRLPAGDDQAARRGREPRGELVEQRVVGVERRPAARRAVSGRAAAPLERQRGGRGDVVARAARGRAGRATARLRCTGPGPRLAARGGVGAAGDGAEVEQAGVVGVVGADLAEPAHAPTRRASAGRSSGRRRSRAAPAGGRR